MVTPTYVKGKRPLKIPLHSVMEVLGDIHSQGHSEKFMKAAKKSGAVVTIDPKHVNFVKDYVADNKLHHKSEVGKTVVGACPGPDPYTCPYTEK